MKTITYNPETHVLVPREPTQAMCSAALAFENNKPLKEWGLIIPNTYEETYSAMLAAAPQPEPNHNWCAGCSPDNCSGCGAEPAESEPAMWVMKHIRSGDLAQAKPNQKALHPYMWSHAFPPYTTPQPVRVAELEAEVLRLREALEHLSKAAGQTIDVRTPEDWVNLNIGLSLSIQALSAPFTPTTLNELVEKVEKMTIERCAERVSFFTPYVGNKIRALPTGQIRLEELL